MSRSRKSSSANTPAYLALTCIGLMAAPALAQNAPSTNNDTRLGGVTVVDTVIEDTGYKIDKADSPKYTAPLLDTPKTVIVVPGQVIKDSGSTSIVEALRTVPGITFGAGEGGNPQGDQPFIRGFNAQGSTYLDGIRSVGGQSREIFAIEQIEVVKGSDSTMGGRGGAGGSIYLVSKQPHLGTDLNADFSYGTDNYKRITADGNLQFAETVALRLNAMWHDADVAKRDHVSYNRWGISPSLALGLGTDTRAFLNYYHLQSNDMPDPGIPFERTTAQVTSNDKLVIRPADVPRDTFYGLTNRDFRKTNIDELLFRFEHDISDTIQIRNTAKFANVKQSYILTQPDDSKGNVQNGKVWRRINTRHSDVNSFADQIDLSGTFTTGSLEHSFAAGLEASWEQSKRGSYSVTKTGNSYNTCPTVGATSDYNCTTLLNPNARDPWSGTITKNPWNAATEATSYAIYANDTITITDSLLLNLGLRYDWYSTKNTAISTTGGVTSTSNVKLKDDYLNYQAGLIYKPASNGSIYVSYAKSTTPAGSMIGEGPEGNAIAAATLDDLKAEESTSYEFGTKWEFFDAALALNLAIFRTDTNNARSTDSNGDMAYIGKRRIDGFEIGINGKPLPFWSIFGGYTYADSKVRYGGNNNVATGRPFPNTPKHSATLWTTFDIAERFQIGGGAIYNSKQYGNFQAVTIGGTPYVAERSVPGYVRFDAMASAKITENIDVRVNVQNLTNKRYYDRTYGTHFAQIAPGRSAFATIGFKY